MVSKSFAFNVFLFFSVVDLSRKNNFGSLQTVSSSENEKKRKAATR